MTLFVTVESLLDHYSSRSPSQGPSINNLLSWTASKSLPSPRSRRTPGTPSPSSQPMNTKTLHDTFHVTKPKTYQISSVLSTPFKLQIHISTVTKPSRAASNTSPHHNRPNRSSQSHHLSPKTNTHRLHPRTRNLIASVQDRLMPSTMDLRRDRNARPVSSLMVFLLKVLRYISIQNLRRRGSLRCLHRENISRSSIGIRGGWGS